MFFYRLSFILCLFFILIVPCDGEITFDSTVVESYQLTGPNYKITDSMGTQMGNNLFYSFRNFNLYNGESATFTGPNSITNVISRVTGGSSSYINGLLSSEIVGANLFFLNPAGVMFGPNASLSVTGSFYVSTADYIRLGTDGYFNASDSSNSVLSVAQPSEFGFLDGTFGKINFDSNFLKVLEGKTLSVVGGDISLYNSYLYAPGGQVNVVSVASKGTLKIGGLSIDTSIFDALGKIEVKHDNLLNNFEINNLEVGSIDSSGQSAGSIYIRGDSFVLKGGSVIVNTHNESNGAAIDIDVNSLELSKAGQIQLNNYSNESGGLLKINSNSITINGDPIIDNEEIVYNSNISSTAQSQGNAGKIKIDTGSLDISNYGQISGDSLGKGKGSSIEIVSASIAVDGHVVANNNKAYATAISSESKAQGAGGDINIKTKKLSITDGATITGTSWDTGNGGNISIEADYISIDGHFIIEKDIQVHRSSIATATLSSGKGGHISIKTRVLNISNAGIVSGNSWDEGKGGDVFIEADNILLYGDAGVFNDRFFGSGIYTKAHMEGDAGNITIISNTMDLLNGAKISASSWGTGMGGNINIEADTINLKGTGLTNNRFLYTSGISSDSRSEGDAGNISVKAKTLSLSDSTVITSSSWSKGKGGNIDITADFIDIDGTPTSIGENKYASGIFSQVLSQGTAGNIKLTTNSLKIYNEGIISSHSFGTGKAGGITIKALEEVDIVDSKILTFAEKSTGGSVSIKGKNIKLENSRIRASVKEGKEDGGKVMIECETFIAYGDTKILASADTGRGGNIIVDSDIVFLSDDVVFDASSKVEGKSGKIDIDSPVIEITGMMTVLKNEFGIKKKRKPTDCESREVGNLSTFTVNGSSAPGILPSCFVCSASDGTSHFSSFR